MLEMYLVLRISKQQKIITSNMVSIKITIANVYLKGKINSQQNAMLNVI